MKSFYITLALLFIPVIAFSQVLSDFTTEVEDNRAILRWSTGIENNVETFEVQRSFDGRRFYHVANVEPTGDYSNYEWTDRDLFKSNSNTYYYRIVVRLRSGGLQVSYIESVKFSTSGINRSWGSIKAMFR